MKYFQEKRSEPSLRDIVLNFVSSASMKVWDSKFGFAAFSLLASPVNYCLAKYGFGETDDNSLGITLFSPIFFSCMNLVNHKSSVQNILQTIEKSHKNKPRICQILTPPELSEILRNLAKHKGIEGKLEIIGENIPFDKEGSGIYCGNYTIEVVTREKVPFKSMFSGKRPTMCSFIHKYSKKYEDLANLEREGRITDFIYRNGLDFVPRVLSPKRNVGNGVSYEFIEGASLEKMISEINLKEENNRISYMYPVHTPIRIIGNVINNMLGIYEGKNFCEENIKNLRRAKKRWVIIKNENNYSNLKE